MNILYNNGDDSYRFATLTDYESILLGKEARPLDLKLDPLPACKPALLIDKPEAEPRPLFDNGATDPSFFNLGRLLSSRILLCNSNHSDRYDATCRSTYSGVNSSLECILF